MVSSNLIRLVLQCMSKSNPRRSFAEPLQFKVQLMKSAREVNYINKMTTQAILIGIRKQHTRRKERRKWESRETVSDRIMRRRMGVET